MRTRIIIAGSGGQGVLFSGKLIAEAAMHAGKNVVMVPTYGAEMRGGSANCSLIVSDEEIESPYVEEADAVVCLNEASFERFKTSVVKGGTALLNRSMIECADAIPGVTVVEVNASDLAKDVGNANIANMVAVGALAKATNLLPLEALTDTVKRIVSSSYAALVDLNVNALKIGYDAVTIEQ